MKNIYAQILVLCMNDKLWKMCENLGIYLKIIDKMLVIGIVAYKNSSDV